MRERECTAAKAAGKRKCECEREGVEQSGGGGEPASVNSDAASKPATNGTSGTPIASACIVATATARTYSVDLVAAPADEGERRGEGIDLEWKAGFTPLRFRAGWRLHEINQIGFKERRERRIRTVIASRLPSLHLVASAYYLSH